MKIFIDPAVLRIDLTCKLVGRIAKSSLVVFAVMDDQVNTDSLEDEEKEEIKMAADEKKDVSHRGRNILILNYKRTFNKTRSHE